MRIQGLLVFAMAVVLEGFAAKSPVLAQGGSDSDLLARVHFMGLNDIAADKTSAKFAEIAALPEGKVLRQEIVSKLATTPFRLMNMNSPPRQRDNAALIRPLVDDVLNS